MGKLVRNKHSSLSRTFMNYRRKMFYQIGLWKACEEQTLQLITNFHKLQKKNVLSDWPLESLWGTNTPAYYELSKITEDKCFYKIGHWMLVRNKHSNLLRTFINYRRKRFYKIGLGKACEEQTLQLIVNFHKLQKKKFFIRFATECWWGTNTPAYCELS